MYNHVPAVPYRVVRQLTFRGVVYEPGSIFDPVEAQCVPHKLAAMVRQRILVLDAPDLQDSLQEGGNTPPKPANAKKQADKPIPTKQKTDSGVGTKKPPTRRRS